jgi:hypothetical protein
MLKITSSTPCKPLGDSSARGAILLAPIADSELTEILALVSRYSDRAIDFAGATLVHLARV